MSFGAARPWSLGVEEELIFVDAQTYEAAAAFSLVLREPSERIKPELFECLVEITTPIVSDAGEALAELRRLRSEVAARAAQRGFAVHAAGTHALAQGADQPLVPLPRYERLLAELGDRVYRQLVCGLHVHVSVPGAEACLNAYEGAVPWLPVLLALSANSPFAEGEATGMRSERAGRLAELPTGGTPPLLESWADWAALSGGDESRRHWDAWPRPGYGTLEVRVTDQQTDVRRACGFAAIVQALVATLAEREPERYDRELYARRRLAAAASPPDPADVDALAAVIEPAARDLGGWQLVEELLAGRPEAERQLEAARDGLPAVVRDVVERSLG